MTLRSRIAGYMLAGQCLVGCSLDWDSKAEHDGSTPTDGSSGDAGGRDGSDMPPTDGDGGEGDGSPADGSAADGGEVCKSCESGTSVSCTTTCGSQGTGICADRCEPTGAACQPPAETCNFADDDCDGVADPNLTGKLLADAEAVFTQAAPSSVVFDAGQVALVPRHGGGGWLMYRAYQHTKIPVDSEIRITRLDENGVATGSASGASTARSTLFTTTSSGPWAVLAARSRGATNDDTSSVRIQLYESADMTLASETVVASRDDDDEQFGEKNDADDCDDVAPLDVAMMEETDGVVRVGVVYRDAPGQVSGSTCRTAREAGSTYFRVVSRNANGAWTLHSATKLASEALLGLSAQVVHIPCRNEWLVAHGDSVSNPTLVTAKRFTNVGAQIEGDIDTFEDAQYTLGLDHGSVDCEHADPTLVLSYSKNLNMNNSTNLRRWQVDRTTGAFSRLGDDLLLDGTESYMDVSALESQGRWFVWGWRNSDFTAHLWEVSFDGSESERLREVRVVSDGGANPGQLASWTDNFQRAFNYGFAGFVDTGKSLILALANRYGPTSNLNSLRKAGDTDPAVAVTYRIGCN